MSLFLLALLGVCLGLAGAIIVEPAGGWEDLRTRLREEHS